LWEVEFKGNRLINLLKEILRQRRIHAVAWVLPVAFSEIYSEFWEQKVKQKYLRNLLFGLKSPCKDRAKEGMVCMSTIGRMPRGHLSYWLDPTHHRLKGLKG
jgi:hypothetical protein